MPQKSRRSVRPLGSVAPASPSVSVGTREADSLLVYVSAGGTVDPVFLEVSPDDGVTWFEQDAIQVSSGERVSAHAPIGSLYRIRNDDPVNAITSATFELVRTIA